MLSGDAGWAQLFIMQQLAMHRSLRQPAIGCCAELTFCFSPASPPSSFTQDYADTGSLRDIAVVKLKNPIGNKIGWLGARAPCAPGYIPGNMPLTAAGYPLNAPKCYGGGVLTGSCFATTCTTRFDCNADLTMHTCDTEAGQSGGPLWDAAGYVRGVHIRGGADASAPYNLATTMTKFMLDNVMSW